MSTNALISPDYSPKAKRERAKEYQLDAIAQFSVLGIPASTIAGITELSEIYINRILKGGQSAVFDKLREGYKQQNLKVVAGAHFELVDMLPEAQQAFRDALNCKDVRVKLEAGKWIHDKVVPNLFKDTDKQDSYHITLNQPHVQAQVVDARRALAGTCSDSNQRHFPNSTKKCRPGHYRAFGGTGCKAFTEFE